MTRSSDLPDPSEGDSLLQDVLSGKRHILFPPGTAIAVAAVMMQVFGAGASAASAMQMMRSPDAIATVWVSAMVATVVLTTPTLMVVLGFPWAQTYAIRLSAVAMALSICLGAFPALSGEGGPWLYVTAVGLFLASHLLIRSRPYTVCAGFYAAKRRYALQQRRKVALALRRGRGKPRG